MGIRTKDIKKSATIAQFLTHIPILLPPSSATLYTAGLAAASFTVGQAFTMNATRSWGGASSISLTATTATGFTAGSTATVLVTGRNEDHIPITEQITLTSTAAATQFVNSQQMFSSVDSAVVVGSTGTLTGAVFAIGIGGGTAGDIVQVPNPIRGVPASKMNGFVTGTATPIVLTSTTPHLRLNYTVISVAGQVRLGALGVFDQDPNSFLEL